MSTFINKNMWYDGNEKPLHPTHNVSKDNINRLKYGLDHKSLAHID